MATAGTRQAGKAGVVTSRVERKRDQKVASILEAAADVLSERGYHNLNLDEIAERLDLTKASLYHYFSSKEELVSACVEALAASANTRLAETAATTTGTASDRLRGLILVQLTLILREQPHLAMLFLQPLDWPEHYRQRTRALRLEHDAIFRKVVREGIKNGEFDVDEDIGMHNLYGAMNYAPVWLAGLSKRVFETKAKAVADNLSRLFLAAEARG